MAAGSSRRQGYLGGGGKLFLYPGTAFYHEELWWHRRGIRTMTPDLLLAFYGDDFTGSTDVLEALSLGGVRTVLFLESPSSEALERFEDVRAVGIAGTSRGMSPSEMAETLPAIFETLSAFEAPIIQYKICSTFDSLPTVGSIGQAIDLAQDRLNAPFVPVVVAAPELAPRGRYVAFGNLFATVDDRTYRLDRHPTMAEHPVTPMTEADLTRHLGDQTDRPIANLELRHVRKGALPLETALDACLEEAEIVVFDGITVEDQAKVGRLIWERACQSEGLVAAASSGLDYALVQHWQAQGLIEKPEHQGPLSAVDQIAVVSGSASPVTAAQIDWALAHGFEGIRLDTVELIDPEAADSARERALTTALSALEDGSSPLLYSVRGPDDPAVDRTIERGRELGLSSGAVGRRLARQQGALLRSLLSRSALTRACVAGGDTSGEVAPALEIFALEYAASVGPGSPLCRAFAREPACDGLELALKGGQVESRNGDSDYFGLVRQGGLAPS